MIFACTSFVYYCYSSCVFRKHFDMFALQIKFKWFQGIKWLVVNFYLDGSPFQFQTMQFLWNLFQKHLPMQNLMHQKRSVLVGGSNFPIGYYPSTFLNHLLYDLVWDDENQSLPTNFQSSVFNIFWCSVVQGSIFNCWKTETIVTITLAKDVIDGFFIENNRFNNLFRFFSFCGLSFTYIFLEFITNPNIVIPCVGTSTNLPWMNSKS